MFGRKLWGCAGLMVFAVVGCDDVLTVGGPLSAENSDAGADGGRHQEPAADGGSTSARADSAMPGDDERDPTAELCNGGELIRSDAGYVCDCAGTGNDGPFCEGSDDDAGAAQSIGGTLSFSSPYYASCAVMTDHTVRCWGRNESGELGDGTRTHRRSATQVKGLSGVTQVDIGLNTTCAVLDDGTLRCWGYNGLGLLRDGSNNDRVTPTVARDVVEVAKVSLGDSQACVRHHDDTLECWTQVDHTGVTGATERDVVDVQAGFFMTTAWRRDGSIRQWGNPLPTIPEQAQIKRVASGYYHACVLADTGRVYCMGSGAGDGQSGENEGDDAHVRGVSDAIEIAAGFEHTCALLRDRTVHCWGQNQRGQLGDGTFDDSFLPVKVEGLEDVTQLDCGRDHSCARREDGSIWCWGSNEYGQLGNGSEEDSTSPVRVLGL